MGNRGRPKKEDAARRNEIYDPSQINGLLDAERAFFSAAKSEMGRANRTEKSHAIGVLLCAGSLTDSNISVWRGNSTGGKEPLELVRYYADGLRLGADRILLSWDPKLRASIRSWWQEEETERLRRALAGLFDQYISEVEAREREVRRAELRKKALEAEQARPDKATLRAHQDCREMLDSGRLPHWMADRSVDGCIELAGSPDGTRQYSGYGRDKVHCYQSGVPWELERSVTNPTLVREAMIRNLRTWKRQEATPGPVSTLLRAFRSPVTDCQEYQLHFGQGDYFTLRTLKEIASNQPLASGLGTLFPAQSWWADDDDPLPPDAPPFHVSAQATVLNCDPDTGSFGIVVTAHDPSGRPLAAGASFSIEEQMKPPAGSPWPVKPWWSDEYQRGYRLESQRGDQHIFDTLKRGLREELGIRESDYASPLLLSSCLEIPYYFVTFMFLVRTNLRTAELHSRWLTAPDWKATSFLALYDLGDGDVSDDRPPHDGIERILSLLNSDTFEPNKYALPEPKAAGTIPQIKLHHASRMRLYVAGCHWWESSFSDRIRLVR